CFIELDELAVDACAHEALAAELLEHLRMLAFASLDHWCDQYDRRPVRQREHLIDHLTYGLRGEIDTVIGATRCAHAGKQQAQMVVDLRDRSDRRTRIVRGRLLLDRDRGR